MTDKPKYYIWVSKKYGYLMSSTPVCPIKPRYHDKMSFMGYTHDIGFPKKMNTGRVLYEALNKKIVKKQSKAYKVAIQEAVTQLHKTGTVLKKQ